MEIKRYYWMDLTRIIACFAVIVIHVAGGDTTQNLCVNVLCHSAVPLFVMISGSNFLDKSRNVTIYQMWTKYIFPLLLTYSVWSFLYAIYTSWSYYQELNSLFFKTLVINTINGHYHMWYIWMTIGMYAIVVFLKKIVNNSTTKELLYFVCLSYIYLSMKYMVQFSAFDSFEPTVTDIRLTFVSGFVIYFLGGYYLSTIEYRHWISVVMGVIGTVGVIANLCIVLFGITCNQGRDVHGYLCPFTIAISFSCYWFLSRFTEHFSEKHKDVLLKVSRLTLPIYMIHDFCIVVCKKIFGVRNFTLVYVFPISIMVFIMTVAISYLFSMNRVTNRIFNGNK